MEPTDGSGLPKPPLSSWDELSTISRLACSVVSSADDFGIAGDPTGVDQHEPVPGEPMTGT